jgi:LDH2 family malate/lactate/ureidoglycolate dehydrogenase
MLKIPYDALIETLTRGLFRAGIRDERRFRLAEVFAGNSAEGVYSHGVNRFLRFLTEIENGTVDIGARTETVSSFGGIEVRDAHFGIGPINAEDAMARAAELSKTHGIACVAVRNTNHWRHRDFVVQHHQQHARLGRPRPKTRKQPHRHGNPPGKGQRGHRPCDVPVRVREIGNCETEP